MITIRKSEERGLADFGWLNSHHTFSFGSYFDPRHMGFSDLRVINDDTVAPGQGFGTHPHHDMEIISYVLEGALEHRDSIGTGSVIRPGEVQLMSAGYGIAHSEFNHSDREPVHFLQIWIIPNRRSVEPGYQQREFEPAEKRGKLRLVVSPDGADESLRIHQQTRLYAGLLDGSEEIRYTPPAGRKTYVHLARGRLTLNGQQLKAGDGAQLIDEGELVLRDGKHAEVLVFDLN